MRVSSQENGNTEKLVRSMLAEAKEAGGTAEFVKLANLNLEYLPRLRHLQGHREMEERQFTSSS